MWRSAVHCTLDAFDRHQLFWLPHTALYYTVMLHCAVTRYASSSLHCTALHTLSALQLLLCCNTARVEFNIVPLTLSISLNSTCHSIPLSTSPFLPPSLPPCLPEPDSLVHDSVQYSPLPLLCCSEGERGRVPVQLPRTVTPACR